MTTNVDDGIDDVLKDVATRFGTNDYGFEDRRRLTAAEHRFSSTAWSSMAQMGWLSVATPEEFDGLGLRYGSMAILAEAAGRMLLSEPLADTGFCGAYLIGTLGSPEQAASLSQRVTQGELRIALAIAGPASQPTGAVQVRLDAEGRLDGHVPFVPGGDIADIILVVATTPEGVGLFLVDPVSNGVDLTPYPLMDGRGVAALTLSGVRACALGETPDKTSSAIELAFTIGALATAADSLGAAGVALTSTLDYLRTRVQFGRPIGTNQALQHRAVDMHISLIEVRSAIDLAVRSSAGDGSTFRRNVHAAKALADLRARSVAQEAIQMHGGIGMADEHMVGHYLKRILVNEQLFGDWSGHLDAFVDDLPVDLSCK